MAGKLAQPGCHTNTGASGKSGRSLVQIDIPPGHCSSRRGIGKKSPIISDAIRKVDKKIKKGKKILGRRASFLQFGSKPKKLSFESPRERVLFLRRTFARLLQSKNFARNSNSQALAEMKENFPLELKKNCELLEGDVPGVEVGDCFNSRAELMLVGLHRPPQAGIDRKDIVLQDGSITNIALSVVLSGGYEDDRDEGEKLVYIGVGGNDRDGTKKQCEPQKMVGGNLALRNSFVLKKSVRVIRGRPDRTSPGGTSYSYDGLYTVMNWGQEHGISGFMVFKFILEREPDQKPLRWQTPVSPRATRSKASSMAHTSPQARGFSPRVR